jgi:cysteine desulfurase
MSIKLPIYMDYHATTPVDPRVLDAMLPYFCEHFGNPASRSHSFGWKAAAAVEEGRKQVADLIGANAKEVVFTSGATESNNLAIKGVAELYRGRGDHIITACTEHKAVLDSCNRLTRCGCRVTCLPVAADGLVDLDQLRDAITDATILVTIMAANNEIGVVQPVADIGRIAREKGVLFHTDAAQAAGKIPFNVDDIPADLVSFTAHKMYGPKGVGALYVRRRTPRLDLVPMMDGGAHERGLRSGTLNVPGIVGFGKAAEISRIELPVESARLRVLRDRLLDGLQQGVGDVRVNGSLESRLPHNLNVSFTRIDGESLLLAFNDIAVSSSSACASGNVDPSHVLEAIGITGELAHASIRFGLGRFTTEDEVEYVIDRLSTVVGRLREMSPAHHSRGGP